MTEPADIASLSFEQALAELEAIVQKLESGQAPLEESIAMYERGARLKAHPGLRENFQGMGAYASNNGKVTPVMELPMGQIP